MRASFVRASLKTLHEQRNRSSLVIGKCKTTKDRRLLVRKRQNSSLLYVEIRRHQQGQTTFSIDLQVFFTFVMMFTLDIKVWIQLLNSYSVRYNLWGGIR